jgi:hypothetical protein
MLEHKLLILILLAVLAAVIVLPYWKIFSRVGFPGWFSLLMVVPALNLIVLYYLAFARWPAHQR